MIGRIAGTLLEKTPPHLLIDCGGIGYELDVPMSTFYHLPAVGQPVVLLTQLIVREDAHLLYGFLCNEERQAFRQLIKVAGIGTRTALAILSGMQVSDLIHTIRTQDSTRLIKIPGIGKKTAERLLLELKDKLDSNTATLPSAHHDQEDILHALVALGYSDKEATLALKHVPSNTPVSDGIRLALKTLSKSN